MVVEEGEGEEMDWNGNLRTTPFVPRPDNNSLSFFYNYNYDPYSGQVLPLPTLPTPFILNLHHLSYFSLKIIKFVFAVLEMKHPGMQTQIAGVEKNQQEKKKRLTTDQLESLENCFQEEIKLDPDRKMKLARELGLQPRQIAVWFQNRRARWKNKQLERLYDSLKQDFDLVSREKLRLQEEVQQNLSNFIICTIIAFACTPCTQITHKFYIHSK